MKSKLSWVPFIPLALVALFCKLAPHFFPDGVVFGLSGIVLDYIFIGAAVLIFLFALLFCAVDKRISPYYLPRRNVLTGILGILLALCLAADGSSTLITMFGGGKLDALMIVNSLMAMIAAIVFVVIALSRLFVSENKPVSLACVFPALFCAVRLISTFVSFTTISLRLADVTAMCCYVFATLFFFYYAVSLSLIRTKSGVKKCMIYGFPAAAAMLAYAIEKLAFSFRTDDLLQNLVPLEMALMGLYILSFLAELTSHAADRDDVVVIDPEDEDEQQKNGEPESADGFFVNIEDDKEEEEEEATDTFTAYVTTADTTDYLYREVKLEEDEASVLSQEDMEKEAQGFLTTASDDDETDDRPKDYETRLDEIDKLILEISEDPVDF